MRLEGLGILKKSHHLIGNRTRDLPACSIVPQQTTLLRAPIMTETNKLRGLSPQANYTDRKTAACRRS
jgi:hypothetical protein